MTLARVLPRVPPCWCVICNFWRSQRTGSVFLKPPSAAAEDLYIHGGCCPETGPATEWEYTAGGSKNDPPQKCSHLPFPSRGVTTTLKQHLFRRKVEALCGFLGPRVHQENTTKTQRTDATCDTRVLLVPKKNRRDSNCVVRGPDTIGAPYSERLRLCIKTAPVA